MDKPTRKRGIHWGTAIGMLLLGVILFLLPLSGITLIPYGRWGLGFPLERWQMLTGGISLIFMGFIVILIDVRQKSHNSGPEAVDPVHKNSL
jgi:hypothetical protein